MIKEYNINNPFWKIITGEIKTNILYGGEHTIVINDINPQDKIHLLIIPKGTYLDYHHFIMNSSMEEKADLFNTIQLHIPKSNNYQIITNSGNKQQIHHFHIHIIGH